MVHKNGRCLKEVGFDLVLVLEGAAAELRERQGVDEQADAQGQCREANNAGVR